MSSGSYLTLYRKRLGTKLSQAELDALKNEYFLVNKKDMFNTSQDEEKMKADMPVLMEVGFKAGQNSLAEEENEKQYAYCDANGVKYDKLLEFHFGSYFICLKEKFNLNPDSFSSSAVLVPKHEVEKMLQAIEYILSEEYSKSVERLLNNEYVELFGEGYSLFDKRFKNSRDPLYIDREGKNYIVNFNDYSLDREMAESDSDVIFNLNHARACFLAYLNAESNAWDNEEIVLEYSAY